MHWNENKTKETDRSKVALPTFIFSCFTGKLHIIEILKQLSEFNILFIKYKNHV
jgi:hypothetical protein